MTIKQSIINKIIEEIKAGLEKIGVKDDEIIFEIPPSKEMGDVAFPMFKYSKTLKKSPA